MGSAPGWQDTPINDGFIWGVNNTHILRDVDMIIDVHPNRLNPKIEKDRAHIQRLKDKDIQAYLNDEIEGMPNVKRYPIEEIKKEFDTDYFGSGVDYIIALAIYKGATEIHLYGVWLRTGSEYAHQKASIEYWIGFGRGRGIKIEVHGESELLRTHNGLMYGYGTYQQWAKEINPEHSSLIELYEKYENSVSDQVA